MKRNLLLFSVLLQFAVIFSFAQEANTKSTVINVGCSGGEVTNDIKTPIPEWLTVNVSAGRYCRFDVISGVTYTWSLCSEDNGSSTYNSQLTLINNENEEFLAYNDDYCDDKSRIDWTATYTGVVRVLVTEFDCQASGLFSTIAYKSSAASVTTAPVTSITETTAVSGGEVTSDGGAPVTARGVVWGKLTAPTITSNKGITNDGEGTGSFTSNLADLPSGTTFFLRAYATNSQGTSYGEEVTFTTEGTAGGCSGGEQYPADIINPNNSIQLLEGILAGQYSIYNVNSGVLYRWVLCSDYGGSASYDSELTLINNSSEELIAYNDEGCSWGDDARIEWTATFTGQVKVLLTQYHCQTNETPATLAYWASQNPVMVVTTAPVTSIAPNSAVSGGEVLVDGGFDVTERGVVCSPTVNQNMGKTSDGAGIGAFTSVVTMLNAGQTYYLRAYATNSQGSVYGNQESFTTEPFEIGCSGGSQYPTSIIDPTTNWNIIPQMTADKYAVFNVIEGNTYFWSMCPSNGGDASYDSELTLLDHSDLSFITYNNDFCDNKSRISWVATFTGQVRVLLTEYSCQTNTAWTTMAYKMIEPFTGGCSGGERNPSNTLSPSYGWQLLTGINAGQYSVYNVTMGTYYTWSLCTENGGIAGYDSELTLINHTTEAPLAYNDNTCGTSAKIEWSATFTGQVRVLVTQNECQSNTISTTLAYKIGAGSQTLCEALDNCNLAFTTSGSTPWFAQTTVTHDGVDAARSGAITHSQASQIRAIIYGNGPFSFWWKVSSEAGYDLLRFRVNDQLKGEISGEVNWQQVQLNLIEEENVLTWTYTKDGDGSAGEDCAWIDQISWGSPADAKLYALKRLNVYPNPFSNTLNIVSESGIARITIVNIGGQKLIERLDEGSKSITLDVSNLTNGLYIITVVDKNGNILNQKVVK